MKATTVNQSAAERNITLVSLANIQPSSFNPRKYFSEPALYGLAESIKQQGILQPITVRPIADADRYERLFSVSADTVHPSLRKWNRYPSLFRN